MRRQHLLPGETETEQALVAAAEQAGQRHADGWRRSARSPACGYPCVHRSRAGRAVRRSYGPRPTRVPMATEWSPPSTSGNSLARQASATICQAAAQIGNAFDRREPWRSGANSVSPQSIAGWCASSCQACERRKAIGPCSQCRSQRADAGSADQAQAVKAINGRQVRWSRACHRGCRPSAE